MHLLKVAKGLLSQVNVIDKFWLDAAPTVVLLINQMPPGVLIER